MRRLAAVWFGDQSRQYAPLARVLEATASRHLPGWEVSVREVVRDATLSRRLGESAPANTQKLELWERAVSAAGDGDEVALLDADTFVTAPLDPAWGREFDVAVTVRTSAARFPLNAGVVLLRAGPRSRDFMLAWARANRALFDSPALLRPWRQRYGGMNQAALGKVLEEWLPARPDVRVLRLPCREWNCEDTSWALFEEGTTRVVHVKSALRMAVFGIAGVPFPAHVRALASRWRAEARAAGVDVRADPH